MTSTSPLTSTILCRHPEQMVAAEAISQWPDPSVPYTFMSLPGGVTLEQAIAAAEWAYGHKNGWAGICGIKPKYVESARNARVLIGSRRIDGPGGVLADCYLPSPGVQQVNLQFDTGDSWDTVLPLELQQLADAANALMPLILRSRSAKASDREAASRGILYAIVLRHEGGHSVGMGHAPSGSANVMAPIYDPKQLTFGQWDANESRKRYGPAVPLPPVTPPVTPPAIPPGGTMGGFFGTLLLNLLKKQLETWLTDGTLQRWLEELLKRIATGNVKTVEQLALNMEEALPLEMKASP